jgi:Replicase family/Primase C terminal 1 (PriCT-1)
LTTAYQLDLFSQRLPRKPYHSNDLNYGLSIASAKRAITSKYIQPNGPTHKYWLVFDLDRPDAALHWDHIGAPAPNITVKNPANGHAHLIYGLEVPIRTAPDGRTAPLRYAAAIEGALRELLGADVGYSGLICKNPLSEHWQVAIWEQNLYSLDWLADYVDLSACNGSNRLLNYGLGRNCNLFEYLAKWAYKAIRQGWPEYEQWFEACLTRAEGYNRRFPEPLPFNEIKATARSVANYTHRNFSPAGFSVWQAIQGAKGGKISKGGGRPVDEFSENQLEPWKSMGVSRRTYYNKKKRAP